MRKKLVTLFVALVVTGALAAGGGALGIRARADETATPAAAQTYGLYVKDELVTARGGKKMTAVSANDAVIKCGDGNGGGVTTDANRKVVSNGGSTGAYFSVASDTAYAFNAGIIGETPAGTTQYRTYGHSEIYFENYPGGVQRGGEWVLAEPVDTAEYSAFSLEIACGSNSAPAGDVNGDAFIYAMGKDAAGNDKIVNGKISFGVGYWSTGVFEWGELLASVDRIAVSVLWGSIDKQDGPTPIRLAGFTVHARAAEAEEVPLLADDMALSFYNGSEMTGLLGGKGLPVYHSNTGYAANFGVTGGAYCYGTHRTPVGNFITLLFKDPVKAADYAYLNLDLQVKAQVADGDWLAEDAQKFYINVLPRNATDTENAAELLLPRSAWATCQIALADLADADGYVSGLVLYYAGNDADRPPQEQARYSVNLGVLNGKLTNKERGYENPETVAYYIEKPLIGQTDVTMRLKMSETFLYDAVADEALIDGIAVNGERPSSVTVAGGDRYIEVVADKALFAFDGTDKVEIEQGVAVCKGLVTKEKETFVYSAELDRFELQPLAEVPQTGQVALEVVEMGNVNENNTMNGQQVTVNTVFVTFSAQICFNLQSGNLSAPMNEVAPDMEDYAYELAKNGVLASVMDKLYVNGKSVREWLAIDKADGKEGLLRVTVFGTNYNGGKALRIMAATESNCKLGVGKAMSVEFKEGFTTPRGYYIGKDLCYKISAENAQGVNSRFDLAGEELPDIEEPDDTFDDDQLPPAPETPKKKSGCSGSVASASAFAGLAAAICLAAFVIAAVRAKARKEQ